MTARLIAILILLAFAAAGLLLPARPKPLAIEPANAALKSAPLLICLTPLNACIGKQGPNPTVKA